jgi:hypothetical protein
MRPVKLPRPTEYWPTCIGSGDDRECTRTIDTRIDYEVGPTMGKLHYRCKLCHEAMINRETRNTVYATAEKETAE